MSYPYSSATNTNTAQAYNGYTPEQVAIMQQYQQQQQWQQQHAQQPQMTYAQAAQQAQQRQAQLYYAQQQAQQQWQPVAQATSGGAPAPIPYTQRETPAQYRIQRASAPIGGIRAPGTATAVNPLSSSGVNRFGVPLSSTAPSSTPSTASQSASTSSTPSNPNAWPPSLKKFVERAFLQCESSEHRDEIGAQLKVLIKRHVDAGTLQSVDWNSVPLPVLPHLLARQEAVARFDKKRKADKEASGTMSLKKSKSNATRGVQPDLSLLTRTELKKMKKAAKKAEKEKQKRSEQESMMASSKKAERADRFGRGKKKGAKGARFSDSTASPVDYLYGGKGGAAQVRAEDLSPDQWHQLIVKGTCQKLEKRYLRLTEAPDPATVRPEPVLKKALKMIEKRWEQDHDYVWVCEQFKSVRQDLTVQHIRNEFTVQVYESHARIALITDDVSEFNQCQTKLHELYSEGLHGHRDEFTAYRLLYFVNNGLQTEIMRLLLTLSDAQCEVEVMRHALAVREAIALSNYYRFFRLYTTAPLLSAYLLEYMVVKQRVSALNAMLRSYRPSVLFKQVREQLAFAADDDCRQFLEAHGCRIDGDKVSLVSK